MFLDGLTGLSDAAAESLCKVDCRLRTVISGIKLHNLPESAAAILRKHPSFADEA